MTHRILSVHQNVYTIYEKGVVVSLSVIKTDLHFTAWEIGTSAKQENGNYETRHFTIDGASRQQKFGNSRWGSFIDANCARIHTSYSYVIDHISL